MVEPLQETLCEVSLFQKLKFWNRLRYEKKAANYLVPVEFGCAVIVWRNLIPLHPGFVSG
jgi:hypothetical protein